jgi:ABC-type transporter Mla MlaB component
MGGNLNLDEDLRIMNVGGQWEKIHKLMSESEEEPVKISFGKVKSLDGAGMQLFLYVCQIAEDSKGKVLVTDFSEKIGQFASLLNLNDFINEVVQ